MKTENLLPIIKQTITFRPSKKGKTLFTDLQKIADSQNRSLNNYIETVLLAHLESLKINQ